MQSLRFSLLLFTVLAFLKIIAYIPEENYIVLLERKRMLFHTRESGSSNLISKNEYIDWKIRAKINP